MTEHQHHYTDIPDFSAACQCPINPAQPNERMWSSHCPVHSLNERPAPGTCRVGKPPVIGSDPVVTTDESTSDGPYLDGCRWCSQSEYHLPYCPLNRSGLTGDPSAVRGGDCLPFGHPDAEVWDEQRHRREAVRNGVRVERERDRLLTEAAALISGDREDTYGSARDGFARTGQIIAAILDLDVVTAEQVALIMAGLKLSRLSQNTGHRDSWLDLAGYAALGGEIATDTARESIN